jgi:hypothetical protein
MSGDGTGDDTEYVQGLLGRAQRIPPGEYRIRDLAVPAGYPHGIFQPGVSLIGEGEDISSIRLKPALSP